MVLPVKASSRAWPSPTIGGRRWRLPRSATIATLTSRTENVASREASRTSHAHARSTPPPMHGPWIAAIDRDGAAGDRGERGLEAPDQREELGPVRGAAAGEEAAVLLERGRQVEAVAERPGARSDDDRAQARLGREAAERVVQLGEERGRHGGAEQRDRGDGSFDGDGEGVGHGEDRSGRGRRWLPRIRR